MARNPTLVDFGALASPYPQGPICDCASDHGFRLPFALRLKSRRPLEKENRVERLSLMRRTCENSDSTPDTSPLQESQGCQRNPRSHTVPVCSAGSSSRLFFVRMFFNPSFTKPSHVASVLCECLETASGRCLLAVCAAGRSRPPRPSFENRKTSGGNRDIMR